MPLVPLVLQQKLEKLHDEMLAIEDPAQAKTHYTTQLAIIITDYVKTATVVVPNGAGTIQ